MSRSSVLLLREILDAVGRIEEYLRDVSYEQFVVDVEKQDAVLRRLEVIGEAVKGLPSELKDRYPDTPWREIAAARNMLVHEYFRVDLELVWEMVDDDLPELRLDVQEILRHEDFTPPSRQ